MLRDNLRHSVGFKNKRDYVAILSPNAIYGWVLNFLDLKVAWNVFNIINHRIQNNNIPHFGLIYSKAADSNNKLRDFVKKWKTKYE